ncbi:MAG: mannose-1-phosphate guanylyltransferase/mannose-6-phosphate isomerase [Desulfobacteraceae bacterium]|nr:mannose-1-phosphate guanylyltransferase/mannose-6-phosphate isomerase [Desulfobacteraceae bacterium]
MTDKKMTIYPVLLAGGSGTRLWPVSRELFPKQLVKFIGQDSLVQNTVKRLTPVLDPENVRIVCGKEHYHEMARHLELIGISAASKIYSEPCGRNTAPAILFAVLQILKSDKDAILCIFPADHVIGDIPKFHDKLNAAISLARQGHIVTFGIQPGYPETGYGYIEGESAMDHGALKLKRFVEKPDKATAEKYIEAGSFFWNAGMFTFRASVMLEEFRLHQSDLCEKLTSILEQGSQISAVDYRRLENISIDYAIMENTERGVVLPSDFTWSDIGSWKSLYDFLAKDQNANVLDGDIITQNTKNCFIMGAGRLVATNNVDNLVIVDTPDSVFISDIDSSRDVKSIVSELKKGGREEYHHHRTVHFPWGSITRLEHRPGYQVDRLEIYPSCQCPENSYGYKTVHLLVTEGQVAFENGGEQGILELGSDVHLDHPTDILLTNDADKPVSIVRIRVSFKTPAADPSPKITS